MKVVVSFLSKDNEFYLSLNEEIIVEVVKQYLDSLLQQSEKQEQLEVE